jgi:4-amino-4-deoxy-L-arabinose transferase-like glycosyltransferase
MVMNGQKNWLSVLLRHPYAFLVLVSILLGGTLLAYPRTSLDNSTYTYVGQTIVHGGMPYRDAWDLKGPALFYAYAALVAMFGKSSVALQVMDILLQLATAFVIFAVGVRIFGKREVGLLAGVLYLVGFYSQTVLHITMTGQTDGFLSLPLALSVLWLLRATENDRWIAWACAGAWVAVVTLFKLPFGLMGVCMIIAALTRPDSSIKQFIRRLFSLGVGFAIPLLLCGFYFYSKGALTDLLDTQLIAALYHVKLNENGHYFACIVSSFLPPVRAPLYILTLLSIVPVALSIVHKKAVLLPTRILLGWFAICWIVFFMHGGVEAYHFTPMFAPVAILSAGTLYSVYSARSTSTKLTLWFATTAVVVLMCCLSWRIGKNVVYEWHALHGEAPPQRGDAMAAYVKQHTSPQDTIFVWGSVPSIYLDSDRRAASRFIDAYHLALPPEGLNYRQVFLNEFTAAKPKYFILEIQLRPDGPCGFQYADFRQAFGEFPQLSEIVTRDYELETTPPLGLFELYRRKN